MPDFYMLIGLPGAGKSKIAQEIAGDNFVVFSSDHIRREFFGDESIQNEPNIVFEEMQRRTAAALKKGLNVIYDATNISRKKRRHLLSSLTMPCKKAAYVVWSRYETCIARDKNRSRSVGTSVLRQMLTSFQPPYFDEGWDEIHFKINDTPYSRADYDSWLDCDHDNPHHNNTVKEHTRKVMSEASNLHYDKEYSIDDITALVAAAGLHDIGKKFVKSFQNSRGKPSETAHYYNHQYVGSYFAIGYDETFSFNVEQRAFIYWLVNVHMDPFLHTKYSATLPPHLKRLLDAFHRSDVMGA